jgi:hypothetical protein
MVRFIVFIFILLILGCRGGTSRQQVAIISNALPCDLADYKTNLQLVKHETVPVYVEKLHEAAKNFMLKECQTDDFACGTTVNNGLKFWTNPTYPQYEIFVSRYVFQDAAMADEQAGHFFIFGAASEGKIMVFDVLDDLLGELTCEINGFEVIQKQLVFYGETYPFFGDAGKFKLSVEGKNKQYQYQCFAK